jgi:hypothetical protein
VVGAERLAPEAAPVGKFDPAFAAGSAHHVSGGEDEPFLIDDHAASGGAADLYRDRGGHHAVDHLEELILDQLQLGGVRRRLGLQDLRGFGRRFERDGRRGLSGEREGETAAKGE